MFLRSPAAGRGISLRTDCQVTALRQTAAGFALELGEQRLLADKVIVCSGGLAGGKVGGSGSGYALLQGIGTYMHPVISFISSVKDG